MSKPRVVVLGAGVAGLTSALLLARTGRYDVCVVAKHLPGDFSIEYTSPWAGANWMSFVPGDGTSRLAQYDAITYTEFTHLASTRPDAGIGPQRCVVYIRPEEDLAGNVLLGGLTAPVPWFANTVRNFSTLTADDVPKGYVRGIAFDSFCVNVQVYLPWLQSQLFALGVPVIPRTLTHLLDAFKAHPAGAADLVVNCTGVMARTFPGVTDKAVYPARGQTVLVRNSAPAMLSVSGVSNAANDEITYIMTRPGGGTILGGCYQQHNWSAEIDPSLAQRIIERAVELCPELVKDGPLDIVRHGVGLRPGRVGGPRVELEKLRGGEKVVHNYGAGGAGYQSSYGMAEHVLELVIQALGV
ncbi:uncharacterized protein V1518DRAFT_416449 [Limtongia smithiae]|uniref:uncharacterized protein n=1 Tax=Limtongia smithiae TaxID=1125753 RepID=UPI0034CE332F